MGVQEINRNNNNLYQCIKTKMSENNSETSIPSNFGAFIPVEEDSESIDEEEQIDEDDEAEEEEECSDENSFQGDYNDGEEFGNQVDLFDVHFGIPSGNSIKHDNLTEADILPENFFQTSYLKAIEFKNENGAEPTFKRQKIS